ncbi:MAG TPA: TIM barrel protein [Phnomibacter sp.]|nr:TIM barrel protein [Phnomibacter sp.]
MQRRNFIRQGTLLGGTMALGGFGRANRHLLPHDDNNTPFHLEYAFHQGMFREHAGAKFTDEIRFAYQQGFRSIEDNGMMGRSIQEQEEIGKLLRDLGMRMGVFVITSDSWHWQTSLATGKKEWKEKMKADCRKAIEVAARTGAKWMTVVPGNYDRSLSLAMQTAHVIDALRMGAEILEPHGLVMVLEPLSDNPDLFLRYSDQTFAICRAVNSPACKILYDAYHMQRNEGNIIQNIDRCWDEIAYFQTGDNPGRKEPGTGEMNYRNIFKHIYQKGYKGIVGMEHGLSKPGKEGEIALIKAYREADNFL